MHPTTTPTSTELAPRAADLWMSIDGGPAFRVPTHPPVVIGRPGPGTIGAQGSLVSTQHLELRLTAYGWVATDLGSDHGTWIFGRRIGQPTRVDQALRLVIGPPSGGCSTLDLYPGPAVAALPAPAVRASKSRARHTLRTVALLVVAFGLLCGIGAIVDEIDPPRAEASASPETGSPSTTAPIETTTTTAPPPRTGVEALPTTVPPTAPGSVTTLEGIYTGDPNGDGVIALLTASLEHVHDYWTRVFEQAQIAPPSVGYTWPQAGQSVVIPCHEEGVPDSENQPSDDDTAVYCGGDDKITIAVPVAVGYWNGSRTANSDDTSGYASGDLSVAFVVAHEYAHNVQAELGISWDEDGNRRYPVIATELHADCLAGIWANAAWRARLIGDADATEAVGALARIGDYSFDHVAHHGTPAQRVDAFNLGYTNGAPAACTPLLDTPAAR